MKKKNTIIDIAKLSGFSKSTVSKVLRNEPYVKKSTREKIIGIIIETGYQPDEIARSLVSGKNINFVGLIVSDITNPFFARIARSIEICSFETEYTLIVCNTDENQEKEKTKRKKHSESC